MEKSYEEQQFKGPGYELFIMLITILSILNLILILFTRNSEMEQVIFFINIAISLILMFDFFYRLLSSPSKHAYFIKDFGWLDLLGSIPVIGFQVLRLFRIIRVIRILREMGTREVSKEFRQQRASSTMATVAFLVIIVLQFGSFFIVGAEENSPNANITSPLDAIWWAFVTITTVGFGDQYPVTDLGRIIGTLVIATGVILFSVFTGFIASKFYSRHDFDYENSESRAETELAYIRELLESQALSLHNLEAQINQLQAQINRKDGE